MTLRAWIKRHFDLEDGQLYRDTFEEWSQSLDKLHRLDMEHCSLSDRYDLLQQDRLWCRSEHWRLAMTYALCDVYKTAAAQLAKAIMDTDAIADPRAKSALEFWEGLSKENVARKEINNGTKD